MGKVNKEKLFTKRLAEDDVEVPGIGTFRVRELSRAEVLIIAKIEGWAAKERKMISLASLDPVLTEREVGQWQEATGNDELDIISTKIAEMSGMVEKAGKQAYADFRGDTGD